MLLALRSLSNYRGVGYSVYHPSPPTTHGTVAIYFGWGSMPHQDNPQQPVPSIWPATFTTRSQGTGPCPPLPVARTRATAISACCWLPRTSQYAASDRGRALYSRPSRLPRRLAEGPRRGLPRGVGFPLGMREQHTSLDLVHRDNHVGGGGGRLAPRYRQADVGQAARPRQRTPP